MGALRRFGLGAGTGTGIIGALFLWRGNGSGWALLALSAIFLLAGLFFPSALGLTRRLCAALGTAAGWLVTRILLSLIFYLVLTPLGVLSRLFGKDFLNRRFPPDAETCWTDHPKTLKEDFERQF